MPFLLFFGDHYLPKLILAVSYILVYFAWCTLKVPETPHILTLKPKLYLFF